MKYICPICDGGLFVGVSMVQCMSASCTFRCNATDLPRIISALEAEHKLQELKEAVTPSADTKRAYIGEFTMRILEFDENGDEVFYTVDIPWITVKDIMKAIRKRATVSIENKER